MKYLIPLNLLLFRPNINIKYRYSKKWSNISIFQYIENERARKYVPATVTTKFFFTLNTGNTLSQNYYNEIL